MQYIPDKNQLFYFHHDICPDDSTFHNPLHSHDLYEIYFIVSGTCRYFIGDRSYSLEAGDIALIPGGIIHHTVYQNTGHTRMLINCASQYIPLAARPGFYLYRNQEITSQLLTLFESIEQEYLHTDLFSEDAIYCYVRLLFFLLSRHPNTYDASVAGNALVTRAAIYLQEHFSEDISLKQIADIVSVSPEHFSRLFKRESGMGFREYLNLLRLQKAEQLLKQSPHQTVAEIAATCGFPDSNYFSVKFKKMYGISPKQVSSGNATVRILKRL